jgi:membrane-associated protease RseP (regulator of RpoE activity)
MAIFIEIIVLIVVLVLLILVHEIGHFIVAKISGMRVDEFGIGYPPRALTIAKIGDTEYTLNILAYILLTATLIIGTPQQIGLGEVATAKNPQVVLESVTPGTPAARAGFMPGDIITKATLTTKLLAESYNGTNAEGYSTLVASDADGDPLTFMIIRGGKTLNITAIPVE